MGNMDGPEGLNLAVISDLHLSEGMDPVTRRYSRNEDFFFDRCFCRFLSYLQEEADRSGRHWKLIIAGDMVDFLQVTSRPERGEGNFEISGREREFGLGTEPGKTVWKLRRIIQGHGEFFAGLAAFLARGNHVVILPGNHDIELCYTEVQEALRDGLAEFSRGEDVKGNLEFRRWFYHEEGGVFVEHGHQYDDLNSFDYFLCPFLEGDGGKRIILPVGSFFVRYLFNTVEQFHPFADNIKPITRFIRYMVFEMIKRPRKLRQLVPLIRFLIEILGKFRVLSPSEKEELEVKQGSIVEEISAEEKIAPDKLEQIRSLWVPSSITHYPWHQVLRGLLSRPRANIHRRYAARIRDILGVKYVVFGHTHDPDLAGLPSDRDRKGEYVNSSTWTKVFVEEESEEKEFVFVQILKNGKDLRMDLLKWRDELGRPERVLLFEKYPGG